MASSTKPGEVQYTAHRNAAREGPSHGHRQHAQCTENRSSKSAHRWHAERLAANGDRLTTARDITVVLAVALLNKLEFHGTDTDTDTDTRILARKSASRGARGSQLATSRTRTTILADLSADLSDTRAFPRKDVR